MNAAQTYTPSPKPAAVSLRAKPCRPQSGRIRVAMRAARGVRSQDIARECGLDPAAIGAWLDEEHFQELVASCRELMALSVEERLKELESLALDLLHIALEERDVRVALFFAEEMSRGRNPARVLAEAVNCKVSQAAAPSDTRPAAPRSPEQQAARREQDRARAR